MIRVGIQTQPLRFMLAIGKPEPEPEPQPTLILNPEHEGDYAEAVALLNALHHHVGNYSQ